MQATRGEGRRPTHVPARASSSPMLRSLVVHAGRVRTVRERRAIKNRSVRRSVAASRAKHSRSGAIDPRKFDLPVPSKGGLSGPSARRPRAYPR